VRDKDLNIKCLEGQGYDGISVTSGKLNGVCQGKSTQLHFTLTLMPAV
jgi:hypothetical protein